MQAAYRAFCNEYNTVLHNDLTYEKTDYNRIIHQEATYAKPNYILTKSQKLPNGLVQLEYYTGEPQNPESQWSSGGSFVPGFDPGVTQTYTLLIDEKSGNIIYEIPQAIDTDVLFTKD